MTKHLSLLCIYILTYINFCFANTNEPEIINLDRTYLAIGDRNTPIKLEFYFKHRFFVDGKFYFGYHQKSFWDINNSSSPILDTNFNPHLYYDLGIYKEINFTLGIFEHLSNGGLNKNSRGINMSYLHISKELTFDKLKIDVAGKFFVSYKLDNDSPDLNEYMGTWSLMLRFKNFLGLENFHAVELRVNSGGKYGTKFSNGNSEIGLYYRPIKKALFNIYSQFFFGRNEYLLDYKIYHRVARVGISFSY